MSIGIPECWQGFTRVLKVHLSGVSDLEGHMVFFLKKNEKKIRSKFGQFLTKRQVAIFKFPQNPFNLFGLKEVKNNIK